MPRIELHRNHWFLKEFCEFCHRLFDPVEVIPEIREVGDLGPRGYVCEYCLAALVDGLPDRIPSGDQGLVQAAREFLAHTEGLEGLTEEMWALPSRAEWRTMMLSREHEVMFGKEHPECTAVGCDGTDHSAYINLPRPALDDMT